MKRIIIILLTLSSLLLVGCSQPTSTTKETTPCFTGGIQPEFNIGEEIWYGYEDNCGGYNYIDDLNTCDEETIYYNTESMFDTYSQRFTKGVISNITYNFDEQEVYYYIQGYMGITRNGTSFVGRTKQDAIKKFQQFVLDDLDKLMGNLADNKQNLFNQFNQ